MPVQKHVTVELGGKSPLIIFDDAHLENAVRGAIIANYTNQGQCCCNGTRVFVQASILDAFLARLVPAIRALRVGDPSDPATQIGPMITRNHQQHVQSYIEAGLRQGARLLCGDAKLTDTSQGAGFFVTPAVFVDCRDDMTIVCEEIFGPIMCVLPFDNENEVIARANATDYGLAAGVFTNDLARAHRMASALAVGTCWINNYNVTHSEMPFGGYKQSGLGRENGQAAVECYSQLKTVYVELASEIPGL